MVVSDYYWSHICVDFGITHKLGGFLANWEVVFLNFSHGIYSMCVPEDMCIVGHPGNPSQRRGGLFYSR